MLVDCRGIESALETVRVSVEAVRVHSHGFDMGTFVLSFLSVSGSGSISQRYGSGSGSESFFETVAEE